MTVQQNVVAQDISDVRLDFDSIKLDVKNAIRLAELKELKLLLHSTEK